MPGDAKKEAFAIPTNLVCSYYWNGILSLKLFWPTVRNICSSDREKLSEINAEGREFAKVLRLFKQWQVLTIFGNNGLFTCSWKFFRSDASEQFRFEFDFLGIYKLTGKSRK